MRNYHPFLILVLAVAAFGCGRAAAPLDLTSQDAGYDQAKIAEAYSREADFYTLKAREQAQRAVVYEALFGADSEWVKGARLLEAFYKESARDRARLAAWHRGRAGNEPRLPQELPGVSGNDGHPVQ